MTADTSTTNVRPSRIRVPRSRGALGGILVLLLGAWAALVPFFGPYLNLAYTPAPNDSWHWTAARGWLEVLPGAAAFVGGILLLMSASRIFASFGGWLAAAGGAWLVVGPALADPMNINLGVPEPSSGSGVRALDTLLLFSAVGAAIVLIAALALGRLSVFSVRDVRAAERRAAADDTAAGTAPTQAQIYGQQNYPPPETYGRDTAGGRHETGPVENGRGDNGRVDEGYGTTQYPPPATNGTAANEPMTVPHRYDVPDAPPPPEDRG